MNSIEYRERYVESLKTALEQLNKLIVQDIIIDEVDPEKTKAAAQGKIEAALGYDKILKMITEQEILIQDERDAEEGTGKAKSFSGVESRVNQ